MAKSLNIAINARVLLPGVLEGIPRYIYETTKGLILNHPEHTFFLFFDRPFGKEYIFAENVVPIILRPQARHPWLWYLWFEHILPSAFTKHNIDLFYSGESFISLKTKVPTLMVIHDLAFEAYPDHLPSHQAKYLKKYVPLFHEKADHVVAVSKFTKNHIIKNYNILADKISVAGNATPQGFELLNNFERNQFRNKYSQGDPYIIYLGSLHPRKNIVKMLQGFHEFKKEKQSKYKLILVGRKAWNTDEIENAIASTPDVIQLGLVENEEVYGLMGGADALLYVSLFEGFGIPVLEAMSCQVPVITSQDSAMSEVGQDAVHLVDPFDPGSIAKGISKVLYNEDYRTELLHNGQKRIELYSWDKTAKHIAQKLFDLLPLA